MSDHFISLQTKGAPLYAFLSMERRTFSTYIGETSTAVADTDTPLHGCRPIRCSSGLPAICQKINFCLLRAAANDIANNDDYT